MNLKDNNYYIRALTRAIQAATLAIFILDFIMIALLLAWALIASTRAHKSSTNWKIVQFVVDFFNQIVYNKEKTTFGGNIMSNYIFSEKNVEFNEFFAQYGEYPTKYYLIEYLEEMTHLSDQMKQCLEHSLRPHIV